jgi:predicted DNA-binding protein with PD1-like motif
MTTSAQRFSSPLKVHVMRLHPHEDLKLSLQKFARENNIKAAIILTCVGSLEQYNLRFANEKILSSRAGHYEIVSLTGTLSMAACHIHLSISDNKGVTTGGHLMEGNKIYTTAEVAIGELPDLIFHRVPDPTYGFHELAIEISKHQS